MAAPPFPEYSTTADPPMAQAEPVNAQVVGMPPAATAVPVNAASAPVARVVAEKPNKCLHIMLMVSTARGSMRRVPWVAPSVLTDWVDARARVLALHIEFVRTLGPGVWHHQHRLWSPQFHPQQWTNQLARGHPVPGHRNPGNCGLVHVQPLRLLPVRQLGLLSCQDHRHPLHRGSSCGVGGHHHLCGYHGTGCQLAASQTVLLLPARCQGDHHGLVR